MEARGSEGADEGPGVKTGLWRATTGTCGAESVTLAKGLRLTLSLGPAVGDLLSDPSLVSKGIRLSKVFIMLLTHSKKVCINHCGGLGRNGRWLQLNLNDIIYMLECLQLFNS